MSENNSFDPRSVETQLRSELEFERRQSQHLRDELNSLKQHRADPLHRTRQSIDDFDDIVQRVTNRLQEAMRSSIFETIRCIVPAREFGSGKRRFAVRWDRVTPDSVVHVSCCEALPTTAKSEPRDYIGAVTGAKIAIGSIACGSGLVAVEVDVEEREPVNIMANVTLLGTPEKYIFNNSGDRDDMFPVAEMMKLRVQHLRNLVGFNEGTHEEFIRALFRRFLRREPDEGAIKAFSTVSREEALMGVVNSPEYKQIIGASP